MNFNYQNYPGFQYIVGITNAQFAVVTTAATHFFTSGEIVSLRVSKPYGMVEINEKQVLVLAYTDTTITLNIDSNQFTPFIFPVAGLNTPPVVLPSSSSIVPGSNPSTMNLVDAFDVRPI
jgi:hypothetical protein